MPEFEGLAEAFLEQSPACCFVVRKDGIFERIYGDPTLLFGRSANGLEGRTVADVLDREMASLWRSRFARTLGGESVALRERHGGSVWWISVFPIRVQGEILYAAGIGREITQFSIAEQELRNTVLSALKAQEFERNMVAKFLHDSIGQNLTAFGLQLDLVRMDLEGKAPETSERVAEMQRVLESMMENVREYGYELNPSAVERAGLRTALDRMLGRIRSRFAGAVRINVDPSLKLDPKIASALYHIAQEAVENAVQHSSCSAIEIAVKSTRNGPSLEVRDNGRGFDPGDILGGCRGLGLLSMEHYAAEAGLDLSVMSNRETGTTVRAATPGPA
jgi:PAS domain S-box-containing protein